MKTKNVAPKQMATIRLINPSPFSVSNTDMKKHVIGTFVDICGYLWSTHAIPLIFLDYT